MKISIWDILTGLILLGIVCLAGGFIFIFQNPESALNPWQPPTQVAALVIPTSTDTPRSLPPTWTPTPSETIAGAPELKPSSTPYLTNTPFVLPSFTPTATSTPTATATRVDSRCSVVDESPQDDAVFSPGQEFDKRWVIRNNTSETWSEDNVDVRFVSGYAMHYGSNALDLPYSVGSRNTMELTIRMRAPSSPGTYQDNWIVAMGGVDLCKFYIRIVVK